jgi:hypothetical protein
MPHKHVWRLYQQEVINMNSDQTHPTRGNKWISGIGPGLAIGIAIGLVTQSILVGAGVGLAICITIIVLKSR